MTNGTCTMIQELNELSVFELADYCSTHNVTVVVEDGRVTGIQH